MVSNSPARSHRIDGQRLFCARCLGHEDREAMCPHVDLEMACAGPSLLAREDSGIQKPV